jgi:hypothetical protein
LADCTVPAGDSAGAGGLDRRADLDLLEDEPVEPGVDDEADREAPHPSESDLPDPLDTPARIHEESWDSYACNPDSDDDGSVEMDPAARRALAVKFAQLKQQAHSGNGTRVGGSGRGPGKTELVVHLTDHTLATGTGVLRVEQVGPALASRLAELIGYGPYTVRPVIDLKDRIPVDAYEVPDRIRERVKLIHPFEQFPFGTAETSMSTDLDHIQPYDPNGPPGQTSTDKVIPLRRFSHRLKTHAPWQVRRTSDGALHWTSPNGFEFRVDHRGTHRITDDEDS